jgi:hypothetical protein
MNKKENVNKKNFNFISDRIGIKNDKGKFLSLADRKRIRENTLARLGKRQRDPFQINTIARTGQKLDQEEQADVALQTMVRNAIEGRGNLNSNVDSNEVPKAAWGTGDYISTGMNILGSFMNKSNTEKSIGAFKFYQYNAKSNNCQDFLINILKSNNLLDKKTEIFIKQDTQQLFDNLPSWSNSFTQLFTDLRAKISELIGFGYNKKTLH